MDTMNQMILYRAHMAHKEALTRILARPYVEYNPEAFTSITLDHELRWMTALEYDESIDIDQYLAWSEQYLNKWFP